MSQPQTAGEFIQDDPHHEGHHGHTIVPWQVLVGVLVVLLAFTALTVSAAQAEKWIAASFDVILPNWVNVLVAMSIAVVKGVLVMMYFMQLRYDKPFNTIIMLFCFLAFGLFLGFTALDLRSRDMIEPWKMDQISAGGMGMSGTPLVWQARVRVAERRSELLRSNESEWRQRLGNDAYDAELRELSLILDRAGIEAYIQEHGLDHYFERLAHYDPRAAGHHDSHGGHAGSAGSSAEQSRPRTGLSGALSATGGHDSHGQDDHTADGHAGDGHTTPNHDDGHASDPTHAEPAHADPTHADPIHADPARSDPDPAHTEPPANPEPASHPG
ncbi:MAG: cytochrome C oxidase subunit IV family protein [Phycisphaerales bacterium]